jgi:hypothetical protein
MVLDMAYLADNLNVEANEQYLCDDVILKLGWFVLAIWQRRIRRAAVAKSPRVLFHRRWMLGADDLSR